MNVNEVVLQMRTELEKSQSEFGRGLGVTKQAVSNWERGTRIPDINYLVNLSVMFNDWRKEFALRCIHAMKGKND